MQKLNEEELVSITGGAVKYGVWAVLLSGVALIIGIIDGIFRPKSCR